MIRLIFALLFALAPLSARAQFDHSHRAWNELLKRHVVLIEGGKASQVRYAGFAKDRAALKGYLGSLSAATWAQFDGWTKPQQLALLINAYTRTADTQTPRTGQGRLVGKRQPRMRRRFRPKRAPIGRKRAINSASRRSLHENQPQESSYHDRGRCIRAGHAARARRVCAAQSLCGPQPVCRQGQPVQPVRGEARSKGELGNPVRSKSVRGECVAGKKSVCREEPVRLAESVWCPKPERREALLMQSASAA